MGFLKNLAKIFTSGGGSATPTYTFSVTCNRCGEMLEGRVNLHNDLSLDYDEAGTPSYVCRKVLMGSGEKHCFQQVEVTLTFDTDRKLASQEISGGKFVE
jgi:hypothetical protein